MNPVPPVNWACPQCKQAIPTGSRFCPFCGAKYGESAAVKAPNRTPWIVGGTVLGVALLVAFLVGAGVLKFGTPEPKAGLKVESAPPPPALKKEEVPVAPKEAVTMPADVRAWLEHLAAIEKKRGALAQSQIVRSFVTRSLVDAAKIQQYLSDEAPAPTAVANTDLDRIRGDWEALWAEYRQLAPPAECAPIDAQYGPMLEATGGSVVAVMEKLATVEQDPTQAQGMIAELEQMLGKSTQNIGVPAIEADRLVQVICDKYETPKWFSINADYGGKIGGALSLGL